MKIEEFTGQVIEVLEGMTDSDVTIRPASVMKNNGVKLNGIEINKGGSNWSANVYLDECYRKFEEGLMTSIEEAADFIYREYITRKDTKMDFVEELMNIEKMRDRIVFRAVNREKNRELIEDAPHVDYLDLVVVFAIHIDMAEGETGSILIHNNLAEKWGVDTDELYKLALMNTPRMLKVSMVSMADTLKEFTDIAIDDGNVPMYVLTNQEKVYGAACILYPGVLKKAAETIGDDLYVIPSSVHETIIVPASCWDDTTSIKGIIHEVNENALDSMSYLSDNLYSYNRVDDRLVAA